MSIEETEYLFNLLYTIVSLGNVSVFNDKAISIYTVCCRDTAISIEVFADTSNPLDPITVYRIIEDDEILASAYKSLLRPANKKDDLNAKVFKKIEKLVIACSNKIISQELESRKQHMLKGINTKTHA